MSSFNFIFEDEVSAGDESHQRRNDTLHSSLLLQVFWLAAEAEGRRQQVNHTCNTEAQHEIVEVQSGIKAHQHIWKCRAAANVSCCLLVNESFLA